MVLDYVQRGTFLHDRLGNLYSLDPDGFTRKIENIGYKCKERVIAIEKHAGKCWLCTNENIIYFDELKDEWISKELTTMPYQSRLPDFPMAFSNKNENNNLIAIQWTSKSGAIVADIGNDEICETIIDTNCLIFTIANWADEVLLLGMTPRNFNNAEFNEFGKPAAFKIDKKNKITNANIEFLLGEPKGNNRQIESVLESIVISGRFFVFCSIVNKIEQHYLLDDDVILMERPQVTEISAIAIFEIDNEKSYLREILDGYTYLASKIELEDKIIFYFSKSHLSANSQSVELLALTFHKKEELYKKINVSITGLILNYSDSKICFFKSWFSAEKMKFYGSLSVYTEGGEKGVLILSDDGYQWKVAHNLYEA